MKRFAIPEGTRDLILGECTAKKRLQGAIEQVFDSYGYKEIVTPSIEFYQTYQTGFEQVQEEAMYKFFDHNGSILTLRMDMTVPIARVAATKFKDQKPPLRFRYCANVYKVKESFAGKRNEVTDCGIELLGLNEKQSDLEILVCALEVMECMQQQAYTLEIGNVNFFHTAGKLLGLSADVTELLADLIDRKSLSELKEYLHTLPLKDEDREFFLQLPWLCGDAGMLKEALNCCFDDRLRSIVAVSYTHLAALLDERAWCKDQCHLCNQLRPSDTEKRYQIYHSLFKQDVYKRQLSWLSYAAFLPYGKRH